MYSLSTNIKSSALFSKTFVNIQSLISTPPRTTAAEAGFELQYPDPSKSPALSTTSTAEGGGSSPILPPLPEPTIYGHTIDLFGTPPSRPPSEPRTDTSAFFTASWGSPYQHPVGSSVGSRSLYRSAYSEASEDSEDLPIRHLELHTPFLRPPPAFTRSQTEPDFVSHDGLISAAVLANRARRPAHRLTEDWIRQHTGGGSTERNNWLSDDPGESENSSLSGSISGGAANSSALESDPRTPTLQRHHSQPSQEPRWDFGSGHRRKDTGETLTQADIASSIRDESSNMSVRNENGLQRTSANHTPVDEKPLPPPPLMAQWAAKALPNPTPSPTTPLAPRLKKKVPWKGKNILVLLPWDEDRGKRGGAPKPMTQKDVVGMLKDWEELGYDTSGFNLGSDDGGEGGPGQSRNGWPLMADVDAERDQRNFRVSIPDKREWDAYVEELKEAKLRALGVSLGDEDPIPIISPAIATLSRRTSMQYPPLPFSPPIPTSSAASSHMAHNSNLPFSPALMPGNGLSTSQSSNQGSIPSPASMHAHLHGKFGGMRHNSVSFGNADHPFGSPFQYPQPTSSPGVWSPQQMLYQHGHRSGSPSMHNLGSIRSPASPLSQDGYFQQGPGDAMSRQILIQNQLLAGARARASPSLQEVRESEDEQTAEVPIPSKSPSKTPTLETKPNVKHNTSASLQREIDDAEYHLEEQFQRQLDGDDYSPHSDHGEMDKQFKNKPVPHVRNTSIVGGGLGSSRFTVETSEEGPVLHHPQPHSRGHSLSQRPFQDSEQDTSSGESKTALRNMKDNVKYDLSDVETNPSNMGTPTLQNRAPAFGHDRDISMSTNPWLDAASTQSKISQPVHRANKQSMSTLNVAARPFNFNPANSFQQNQFSFTSGNFQPAHTALNYVPFVHQGPLPGVPGPPSNHAVKNSFGKINAPAQVFSPNLPGFVPGHSEFNFQGPSFRPDAPTFTPSFSSSITSTGEASGNEAPQNPIFGGLDLNSLSTSKPSKKSKAIPIVRPDSSHSKEVEETMEDNDGRPMQNPNNIKRMRRDNDNGDSVPLSAEPAVPLQETTREQPSAKARKVSSIDDDKENFAPSNESADELPAANVNGKPSSGADFSPFEFQQQKQAEDFNAAIPFTSQRYESGLPGYGVDIAESEDDTEGADETAPKQDLHSQTASNASGSQLGHRKTSSSLSATAKPFENQPKENAAFTFGGNQAPVLAPASPVLPKIGGLANSRYANSPSPPRVPDTESPTLRPHEVNDFQNALPGPQSPHRYDVDSELEEGEIREDQDPTFEEIDAVMRHLNSTERSPATVSNGDDTPRWHETSPRRHIQIPSMSSPIRLHPNLMRSDAPSPSPGLRRYADDSQFGDMSPDRVYSHMGTEDDPFADPHSTVAFGSPIHRLNTGHSLPISDWDDVLSEGEEIKLHERIGFFDNRVNDIVGSLLADRLDPIERILEGITDSLHALPYSVKPESHRREQRSMSGALSDADDEDDEEPGRSASPRRNAKLEKIRMVVLEALNTHSSRPQTAITPAAAPMLPDSRNVLQALDEMKEHLTQSSRSAFNVEDFRKAVEDVVERRIPGPVKTDDNSAIQLAEAEAKIAALEQQAHSRYIEMEESSRARISELEEKLHRADDWVEEEIKKRRAAEDSKAMTERLLASSLEEETRLRQIVDEKSSKAEIEYVSRRKAEDRLAEAQRLLRVSSEEEDRLRDAMLEKDAKIRQIAEDRDHKVRGIEESRNKTTMRIALLEAAQENFRKTEADLTATIHMAESELRESRSLAHRWQLEAEGAMEAAKRHSEDAEQANETNRDLRRTIETLKNQMEESIRVRESMRSKLMDLQEDMATAARNISQENSHRAKKEQELLARQEVLDAKLHAEARTRERLELEIERLESGERQGMRAVSECKRLEALVIELRNENHAAHKDVMRYKREFEEARESGLGEVARTRKYMQVEVETANNEVNVVREELENQISRLQAEIDLVKLDGETAKEQHDMLLEAAQTAKKDMFDDITRKHQDQLEDLQDKLKRQLENTIVDAQRSEQHLLERLSLSTAKTEHLQDRVSHLEDKLEVARSAAQAAATHAKAARSASVAGSLPSPSLPKASTRGLDVPEKISPQALRESIMVLQDQLQDRELKIEDLEQKLMDVDPEASTKISKRDDEISWLRELLSVRKSDLQDIVQALSKGTYNPDNVRDAAIRLSANLQMEEQERERAMNGGSAINLPNIAASIAASPRVAQVANAVGPLAAAWGNWRNKNQVKDSNALMSGGNGYINSSGSSTPSKAGSSSGFLTGLMTPPASSARQFPSTPGAPPPVLVTREPTTFARDNALSAFNATSQRFAARQGGIGSRTSTPRRADKVPVRREAPATPPMMSRSSYDTDAVVSNHDELGNGSRRGSSLGQPSLGMSLGEELGDFGSEEGFYDDDESTVDEMAGIYSGGFGR